MARQKKAEQIIEEPIKEVSEMETPKTVEKRKVNLTDDVEIMINSRRLFYEDQQMNIYLDCSELGTTDSLTVAQLKRIKNNTPRVLDEAWIIILDEDVVNFFGLTQKYKYLIKSEEMDTYFEKDLSEMKEILKNCPKQVKENIMMEAIERVNKQKLTDIVVIQMLEKELNYKLIK